MSAKSFRTAYRDCTCGDLRLDHAGQVVKLAGWIQNYRDHGGVLFIDLRDQHGISQVVIPLEKKELQESALKAGKESCISVQGVVKERPAEMVNSKLATGEVELYADEITTLGKVRKPLPFEVWPDRPVNEELRLKYRYLDLRREGLHDNIILRSKVINSLRQHMVDHGFLEMQTPILTSSSPEGARDYLVPSRIHPGKFYALPQAPQQFKQILMVSGFDRYFQIAPCFRDEDARADRSPGEFYQLDLEMSFASQEDVFGVVEEVMRAVFEEFTPFRFQPEKFPRIPYLEAMVKYGSDKPDLRNPLEIADVSDLFESSGFKAFSGKTVRVIPVEGCASQPRSFFDKMVDFATGEGGKGLAWVKVGENLEFSGPIVKFLEDGVVEELKNRLNPTPDTVLFFVADTAPNATRISGAVRTELGNKLDLLEKDTFRFCWIVDFPMYEMDEETQQIEFSHNPFSMPQGGMDALENKDPLSILAYQYDIVCNGCELSSGAVRNHDPDIMVKAFEIAGYDENTVKTKFPALLNAFNYGPPPHAGIAPGVDRIVMLIANQSTIREVIAFPMNAKAQDLLMNAPNQVSERQLRDVHISVNKPAEDE